MKKLLLSVVTVLALPLQPLQAQELVRAKWIEGPAKVIDGDSIVVGDETVRLFGIDAPEMEQRCYIGNLAQNCGKKSAIYLSDMIYSQKVRCRVEGQNSFGRTLATCIWNGRNINEIMVLTGNAVAWPHHSNVYNGTQKQAKASRAGIWNTTFATPLEWRKAVERKKLNKQRLAPVQPTDGHTRKAPVVPAQ